MLLHLLCTSVLPYVLYTIALTHVETGRTSILAASAEPIAAMYKAIENLINTNAEHDVIKSFVTPELYRRFIWW